jgi:hypothetical protein
VKSDSLGLVPNDSDKEDSENIKDSDIATIEALHDLLLDGEGYPLNHPTLKRGRELTAKLYKILGYNSH